MPYNILIDAISPEILEEGIDRVVDSLLGSGDSSRNSPAVKCGSENLNQPEINSIHRERLSPVNSISESMLPLDFQKNVPTEGSSKSTYPDVVISRYPKILIKRLRFNRTLMCYEGTYDDELVPKKIFKANRDDSEASGFSDGSDMNITKEEKCSKTLEQPLPDIYDVHNKRIQGHSVLKDKENVLDPVKRKEMTGMMALVENNSKHSKVITDSHAVYEIKRPGGKSKPPPSEHDIKESLVKVSDLVDTEDDKENSIDMNMNEPNNAGVHGRKVTMCTSEGCIPSKAKMNEHKDASSSCTSEGIQSAGLPKEDLKPWENDEYFNIPEDFDMTMDEDSSETDTDIVKPQTHYFSSCAHTCASDVHGQDIPAEGEKFHDLAKELGDFMAKIEKTFNILRQRVKEKGWQEVQSHEEKTRNQTQPSQIQAGKSNIMKAITLNSSSSFDSSDTSVDGSTVPANSSSTSVSDNNVSMNSSSSSVNGNTVSKNAVGSSRAARRDDRIEASFTTSASESESLRNQLISALDAATESPNKCDAPSDGENEESSFTTCTQGLEIASRKKDRRTFRAVCVRQLSETSLQTSTIKSSSQETMNEETLQSCSGGSVSNDSSKELAEVENNAQHSSDTEVSFHTADEFGFNLTFDSIDDK